MNDLVCYYNGDIIPESEVKLPLMDLGFRHGYGVFDFSRSYNHVPFFWKEHIERLYRGLKYAYIDPGLSQKEMLDISYKIFNQNKKFILPEDDYGLLQLVTAGAPEFHAPPDKPTVLVRCMSLLPLYKWEAMAYQKGIPLLVASRRQAPPECWDVRVKSLSRIYYDLAKHEAAQIDPEAWPLLLDTQGRVAETHTSNVFIVKNNKIFTPRENNILVSITRNVILKLAKEEGMDCIEMDLYPYDLDNADEIFLTHTSTTIIPVNKFNHEKLSHPVPGPITRQLLAAFSRLVGCDIVDRVLK